MAAMIAKADAGADGALAPFDAARASGLEWTRHGLLGARWTLAAGGATVATLERRSALRAEHLARMRDAGWTLDCTGFLRRRVIVREAAADRDVGELRYRWNGEGTLVLAGGRELAWRKRDLWGRRWAFQGLGPSDIEFTPNWRGSRIAVEAPLVARRDADAPLLLCVGAYLLVLSARRQMAAAS